MILEKHKRDLNKRMNELFSDIVKSGRYDASLFEVIMQPRHTDSLIFVFKTEIDGQVYYLAEKYDLKVKKKKQFYSVLCLHEDFKGVSFRDILDHSGELVIETVEENGMLKSKIASFFLWESVPFDSDLDEYDDDEYDSQRG